MHSGILINRQTGKLPPRAPRNLFGRESIVKRILGLTQSSTPIALSGGGSGKTPIALTVLHREHARKVCNERRVIRCDEFPASVAHFLNRLQSPRCWGREPHRSLPPHPLLSSKQILIALDSTQMIPDPKANDARAVYSWNSASLSSWLRESPPSHRAVNALPHQPYRRRLTRISSTRCSRGWVTTRSRRLSSQRLPVEIMGTAPD